MSRGPMPSIPSGFKAPPVAAPDPPSWLEGDALAEWERIVPLLLRSELVTEWDQISLAAYCQACAELIRCTKLLDEEGRFFTEPVQNAKGDVIGERKKAHPALSAQRDAFSRVKAFLAEFGLTPAARVRLKLMKDGGTDALTALLAGQPEATE